MDRKTFTNHDEKSATNHINKEDLEIIMVDSIEDSRYPGIELEDYYLYYLQNSLKDSMATKANVLYITKRDLLFEVDKRKAFPDGQKDTPDKTEIVLLRTEQEQPFEIGKDIQLKLQIPFRNEFIRATGRITGVDNNIPDAIHVKLRYTKILGGDNEVMFDTILDMLI